MEATQNTAAGAAAAEPTPVLEMPWEEAARIAATRPYWNAAVSPGAPLFFPTHHWLQSLAPHDRVVWCAYCAAYAIDAGEFGLAEMALRLACTNLEDDWPGVADAEVEAALSVLDAATQLLIAGNRLDTEQAPAKGTRTAKRAEAAAAAVRTAKAVIWPWLRHHLGVVRRIAGKAAGVSLIDGEARQAAHPATFEVPCRRRKQAVGAGWFVKIGAEFPTPEAGEHAGERFWVEVTSRAGDRFRGRVNNVLIHRDFLGLDNADDLEFEARHILNILPPPPPTSAPRGSSIH